MLIMIKVADTDTSVSQYTTLVSVLFESVQDSCVTVEQDKNTEERQE